MKQKLHKIVFFYFVFASIAAYLITIVSLIAGQNWHEYFVSPVYLYCQLLPAGVIMEMPTEVVLSILPFLFSCASFILYLKKKGLYSMFLLPVLLGNIVLIALFVIVVLLIGGELGSVTLSGGGDIACLLSIILQIPLLIVLSVRYKRI